MINIGRIIVGAGAVLVVSLASVTFYACSTSDDGHPIVTKKSELASPDGKWIATLELVDNGLGFGLGVLYDEVHLRRVDEPIFDHGNDSKSSVFYIDAMETPTVTPNIRWYSSTHLIINYDGKPNTANIPGKCITSILGISIEYQPKCKR